MASFTSLVIYFARAIPPDALVSDFSGSDELITGLLILLDMIVALILFVSINGDIFSVFLPYVILYSKDFL